MPQCVIIPREVETHCKFRYCPTGLSLIQKEMRDAENNPDSEPDPADTDLRS